MRIPSNPISYLFAKTWEYSEGNRKKVVFFILLFIVGNVIHLVETLVVARIFNIIQAQGISLENIYQVAGLLCVLLVFTVLFWACHGPARMLENENAFFARKNYKKFLLEGVLHMPMEWHANHHSGDTIDKIEKGTTGLFRFSSNLFQIVQALTLLIGSLAALGYFYPTALPVAVILALLTFVMVVRFDRVLIPQYKLLNKAENTVSEKIYDAIGNVTTVVILRVERMLLDNIVRHIWKPFSLYKKNNRLNEWKWFSTSVCASLITIVVVLLYVIDHARSGEVILVGTVYILYTYAGKVADIFYRFADLYSEIAKWRAQVANVEEISKDFLSEKRIAEGSGNEDWRTLEVRNLSFSYEEDKRVHLDNLNFTLKHGERVAFIGESGSGKTTLLKIIRDLYRPSAGEVILDGQRLPEGFGTISETIALIPQDPEIFTTSILENITIGADHSPQTIEKYTDMASFTEVAKRLPRGLKSSIVEKGVNLSGGERQRLALARGLLASEGKSIILLDEPTSSVDFRNEVKIFKNIFSAFPDQTILSSVHRLNLLFLFDTIFVFQNGQIVAQGPFDSLLESSEVFQDIWERYTEQHKEEFIT